MVKLSTEEKIWIAKVARNTLECHYRGDARETEISHAHPENFDLDQTEVSICRSLIQKCKMY